MRIKIVTLRAIQRNLSVPLSQREIQRARTMAAVTPAFLAVTRQGAKAEIAKVGSRYRYRVSGYAFDGSDVASV